MITITALTLLSFASAPLASDPAEGGGTPWSRFRGPNGTGVVADDTPLPDAIGPENNLSWKAVVPGGYSSPVLTSDSVFLTGLDDETLLTFCFDRASGEERWTAVAPDLVGDKRPVNNPASATPVTDGENVYVFFEDNGLLSYNAHGELRWQVTFDEFYTPYGMSTSPILEGDRLVMQCDHDGESFLVAWDKDTGKELWRTERPESSHGYSSPVIYQNTEGPTEIVVSGSYEVAGYDINSGAKLWWANGFSWQPKCLPVVAGDVVYVSSWMASLSEFGAKPLRIEWDEALTTYDSDASGDLTGSELEDLNLGRTWFFFDTNSDGIMDAGEWRKATARARSKNGLVAIRLGGRGDVTETHIEWRFRRSLPNIPSPVLYNDLLYVLKEGGVLTTLNPETGEILQDGRIEDAMGTYYASPIAGDGKLYTVSADGDFAVTQLGEEWTVLNVQEFGEPIWATPAIDNGQVFVRSLEALYCFAAEEAGEAQPAGVTARNASVSQQASTTASDASWSVEGADEPLWSAEVGLGYSSIVIENERLYTLGFDVETEMDFVWCMEAETGEVVWRHEFPAKRWKKFHNGGTNTTPLLDGDTLYTLNRDGVLHSLNAATGEVNWSNGLVTAFGVELPTWGFAATPVSMGDNLLINVGRALLLDKATGEERWVSEDFGHAYSTPVLFEFDGKEMIALFNGKGLAILDAGDGTESAFKEWKTEYDVNAAAPIIEGDKIFISSGYNHGASMLQLTEDGLETVWESSVMRNKMSGCANIGDNLYGFDEAILKCINKDGEAQWSERGLGNGAVTAAGDRILVITSDGELIILAATPEEFRVLSRKTVLDTGGIFWTMPTIANGLIYCRDNLGNLVCLDHRSN
ncbi:MAG: outer membrane protein assembly factor BamB [Gammaproteobacteria bacterium]|jgi:outer membrane protein assembly factor BamB